MHQIEQNKTTYAPQLCTKATIEQKHATDNLARPSQSFWTVLKYIANYLHFMIRAILVEIFKS